MTSRIRKDAHKLTDDTLDWYAKAVTAMRALPATDPRSWEYQATIHGDPAAPTSIPKFWDQCQHGTSFFAPWHRMYLFHFERIVAKHVSGLGGPADWALPYWNYSTPAPIAHHSLPAVFRDPASSLYESQRDPGVNAGNPLASHDTNLRRSMHAPSGTGPSDFFGGAADAHFARDFGMLEGTVHNNVHGAVGGARGLMADPYTAALDPIFWLHHANIDRLWEVWRRRDPAHVNLAAPYWLSGVGFDFNEAGGGSVTMWTRDVLAIDVAAPGMDYTYEDLADPFAGGLAGGLVVPMAPSSQLDLVGSTTAALVLDDRPQHVPLPTPVSPQAFKQSNSAGLVAPAPARQLVKRVTLQLEHVTSTATAPAYDVYVNVPDGADPSQHDDRYVGRATMFGVKQASDPTNQHGGGGQNFAFDITGLYYTLSDANAIDPSGLRVSFVPVRVSSDAQVKIGRVALYFA